MATERSPEDSPGWKDAGKDKAPVLICRSCRQRIINWHCEESGCPWCASCGERNKVERT